LAKTYTPELHIESYPLVFPNETTEEMSDRWEREVVPRLAKTEETENRLVIAVPQDPITMSGSSARARLHLANILDRAQLHNIMPSVVVPTPIQYLEFTQLLAKLNTAYMAAAERPAIIHVDTITDMFNHQNDNVDLIVNDGLPGQAAYGVIAWLELNPGSF